MRILMDSNRHTRKFVSANIEQHMQRVKLQLSLLTVALFLTGTIAIGQVYSNKEVGKKNQALADSIKKTEYPYALPIWGKRAAQLGFNLPYSAGLSVNYLWQRSKLTIENLQIGFNNGPMTNLDEVIRFDNAVSEASGLNFRPDIWVFPFLNVYGILAKSSPSTTVDYSIYVPDESGSWNKVVSLNSQASFQATTAGFGLTPTIGVGGGWFALDMNMTWSDIPELAEPAFAFVFGPRLGKSFKFRQPDRTLALWAGGFRLKLNTGTSGSLYFKDVFPVEGLQARVDAGIQNVNDIDTQVESWWSGLSAAEQLNPVNKAKYETANRAIDAASAFLGNMDAALNDDQYATVQYSLDKRPQDMWNFVLGTQYQHNKHWMVRFEYGFMGSRTQVIAGLQYRFGL